jgi:hypothetical protein
MGFVKWFLALPRQQVTPMVGGAAGNPGTTDGDRTMNEKNELTKNDKGPALHEVETAELQAIVGGQAGGHGHSDALLLGGEPWRAGVLPQTVPVGALPLPTPWRAAAFPLPTPWRAGV